MTDFGKLLLDFTSSSTALGPMLGRAPGDARKDELRAAVHKRIAANEKYFVTAFAVVLVLAIAAIVAAFLPNDSLKGVQAGLGISAAGAAYMAVKTAREKAQFEIMLELASGLDDAALRTVLNVLAAKYSKPDPAIKKGSKPERNAPRDRKAPQSNPTRPGPTN